jgi:hypothetical protein
VAGASGFEPELQGFGDLPTAVILCPYWYRFMESNHADGVHNAAPYHPIGLTGIWSRQVATIHRSPAYETGAFIQLSYAGILAGEDGFEPPTVRFKVCRASDCATRLCWRPLPATIRLRGFERAAS